MILEKKKVVCLNGLFEKDTPNFEKYNIFPFFLLNMWYNKTSAYGMKGNRMSLFKKIFKRSNTNSVAYRRERAAELHGQSIRYVTERCGEVDEIVGRGGCLSVRNGEFLLLTSGDILFRTRVEDLQASYLMSGDGVVLSGPNMAEDGRERTLIAYFVYYRK